MSEDVLFWVSSVVERPGPSSLGGLVFLTSSQAALMSFLERLLEVAYPEGGRSVSTLAIDRNVGSVALDFASYAGIASIFVRAAPDVGAMIRRTLETYGSVPIVFGVLVDGSTYLLDPRRTSMVRKSAVVDDALIEGGGVHDWKPFLAALAEQFPLLD